MSYKKSASDATAYSGTVDVLTGKAYGQGSFTCSNGEQYIGEFKDGEFKPSVLQHFITKIDHTKYPSFAKYHDSKASDIYWNINRINGNFNNWIIYSYW
jgi:hypothetical protein